MGLHVRKGWGKEQGRRGKLTTDGLAVIQMPTQFGVALRFCVKVQSLSSQMEQNGVNVEYKSMNITEGSRPAAASR